MNPTSISHGLPALVWLCTASLAVAREQPRSLAQLGNEQHFGQCVAAIGDVDGDGRSDIAISAPGNEIYQRTPGFVHVYSGKDGVLRYTLKGRANGDGFGVSIAALGDLDGDGRPDFAVSASNYARVDQESSKPGGVLNGYVQVHSGRDGKLLFALEAPGRHTQPRGTEMFGWRVVNAGDLDADGRADVAISAPAHEGQRVFLVSTGTREVIRTLRSAQEGSTSFGYALASAGDVDGDALPDLIVGTPSGRDGGAHPASFVEVFSGADGRVLRTIHGSHVNESFGRCVQGGTDIDRDGVPDLIVGAVKTKTGSTVRFFSGKTGEPLTSPAAAGPDAPAVACVIATGAGHPGGYADFCVLGDLDGDGVGELLASHSLDDSAEIFALRPPFRRIDAVHAPRTPLWTFGSTSCALGDVDGDGVSDFAIGSPFGKELAGEEVQGGAWIYSGVDRKLLHAFAQPDA